MLTEEVVESLLRKHFGNFAGVARACKVSRQAVRQFVNSRPNLKDTADDCREIVLDEAESALHKAAKRGEPWAVCFLLKTQGKSRGYVEKADLNLKNLNADELEQFHKLFTKAAGGTA